jgi:hypothetical protein
VCFRVFFFSSIVVRVLAYIPLALVNWPESFAETPFCRLCSTKDSTAPPKLGAWLKLSPFLLFEGGYLAFHLGKLRPGESYRRLCLQAIRYATWARSTRKCRPNRQKASSGPRQVAAGILREAPSWLSGTAAGGFPLPDAW